MDNFTETYLQMFKRDVILEDSSNILNRKISMKVAVAKLNSIKNENERKEVKAICEAFKTNFPKEFTTLGSLINGKSSSFKDYIKKFNDDLVKTNVFSEFEKDDKADSDEKSNENSNKTTEVTVNQNNINTTSDGSTSIEASVKPVEDQTSDNDSNTEKTEEETEN